MASATLPSSADTLPASHTVEVGTGLYRGIVQDLAEGRHVIGSGEEVDLVLLEPGLAAQHAAIALRGANASRWANAKLTRNFEPVALRLVAPAARARYRSVSARTDVPWAVIAVIHERESSQDWTRSLAQGDRWDRMSVHTPAGRGPFKSWEEAAIDALVNCAPYPARNKDWSVGGTLTMLEEYNGLGYAARALLRADIRLSISQREYLTRQIAQRVAEPVGQLPFPQSWFRARVTLALRALAGETEATRLQDFFTLTSVRTFRDLPEEERAHLIRRVDQMLKESSRP